MSTFRPAERFASTGLAQHRKDRRRRTDLDRIHDLEAVPPVKGGILQVRRPEVCRTVLPVASAKTVLQQISATPLVPVQSFDADERQVPMGLGWPIMFGPLEDGANLGLFLAGNAFCNNRIERAIIAVNPRRKPKRDAEAVAGALRRVGFERARSKGLVQSMDEQQVSVVMQLAC